MRRRSLEAATRKHRRHRPGLMGSNEQLLSHFRALACGALLIALFSVLALVSFIRVGSAESAGDPLPSVQTTDVQPSDFAGLPDKFLFSIGAQAPAGQFTLPSGVAVGTNGDVYVADTSNSRIQVFDRNGNLLRTWGSLGAGEGQFSRPSGLAIGPNDTLYVADTGNNRIQRFHSNGRFIMAWGNLGSGQGQFNSPSGVAVDSANLVYVADRDNNRIQRFSGATNAFLEPWGSPGSGDFDQPSSVAIAADGSVYIADASATNIAHFDANGHSQPTIGSGLYQASSVAVGPDRYIYVADTGNNRILRYNESGAIAGTWGTMGSAVGSLQIGLYLAVGPPLHRLAQHAPGATSQPGAIDAIVQRLLVQGQRIAAWGC